MFSRIFHRSNYPKPLIRLSAALAGLSLLLIFASSAGASSTPPQNITISPSSIELSAPPGGSTQGSITVVNGGSSSFNFNVYANPYYVTGVNYNPTFTLLPGKTDASQWVHISGPPTQSVGAGASNVINYSLNVPANTAPGGYYAVLFAETQSNASNGVASRSRVGDIFYITVQGPVTQSGTLQAVKTPKLVIATSLPLSTEVSDSGGLHFVATPNIKLVNAITGHVAYSASLPRYVLPQTIRKITTTDKSVPLIGLYKVEVSANILGKTQSLPNQWVFIIHPLAIVFIPILIVLIIIYFRLPKSKAKSKKKHKRR